MQQYYTDKYLNINDKHLFNDEDSHHIRDVLRLSKGEIIRIVYKEEAYLARIDYENKKPYATIIENDDFKRDLSSRVILIQGLIKLDKWDLILQKASELGVSDIVPLYTSRVNLKKDVVKNKKERWNKIILESCKQCKRESLVTLHDLIDISDLEDYKSDINLIAYENDFNKDNNIMNYLDKGKTVSIIIGPEGGFSDIEIDLINKMGFTNINLGKRILRAETACFYALSVIGAMNEGK